MRRVAVVCAVVLAATACSSTKHDAGGRVGITNLPRSYFVSYDIDNDDVRSTETLTVRRPFDGRDERGSAISTSSFARLALTGSGTAAGVQEVLPAPAVGDVRVDIALAEAIERGMVERLDATTVTGRPCQRYRSAVPPAAAHLQPLPGGGDGVRFCVDRDGLVLDERTIVDGHEVRRRTARSVRVGPVLRGSRFSTSGDPVPVASGGGLVRRLTDGSRTPGDFWELEVQPVRTR